MVTNVEYFYLSYSPENSLNRLIFHSHTFSVNTIAMGPGKIFWPWLGGVSFCCSGSDQPSLGLVKVWTISPKNIQFFNFVHFGSKKSLRVGSKSIQVKGGSASYLLQVKSMLALQAQSRFKQAAMFSFLSPISSKFT